MPHLAQIDAAGPGPLEQRDGLARQLRVRSLLRDERGDASGGVKCLSIVRVAKKTAIDVLAGEVPLSGSRRSTAR